MQEAARVLSPVEPPLEPPLVGKGSAPIPLFLRKQWKKLTWFWCMFTCRGLCVLGIVWVCLGLENY